MKPFEVETENLIYTKRKFWLDYLGKAFVLVCCIIAVFIIGFTIIYNNAPVTGKSMQPTLNKLGDTKSDTVYINKFATFTYGDIIVIRQQNSTSEYIIKRVIGLAGDKIEIKRDSDNQVYVFRNGIKLEEDYIYNVATSGDPTNLGMESTLEDFENLRTKFDKGNAGEGVVFDTNGALILQKGQVFVLGDNRGRSLDSADSGAFSTSNVVGRVDYIVPYGTNSIYYFIKYFSGIDLTAIFG